MNHRDGNAHDLRCSEPECGSKIHARGLCQAHYKQRHFDRKQNRAVDYVGHEGLVRVNVRGWGSL